MTDEMKEMAMLVIPAIDLKDGKCVRLRQGRMDDETIFSDRPVDMAAQWFEQGARRLHLVDLNGAFEGKPMNGEVVKEIADRFPDKEIQIGGGIRDLATIQSYIDAGVDFVIIGTKAVEEPGFVQQACDKFPGHIIVGIDAKDGWVATDGWAKVSEVKAVDLAKQFQGYGVSAIVYTDISRDGMMQGVNVSATSALASSIDIPVIASGGVTNIDDIAVLCEHVSNGISGAITGRAIYEGGLDLQAAQLLADEKLAASAS